MGNETQAVTLEVRDGIARVRVDNPPVHALARAVRDGLLDCTNARCARAAMRRPRRS
jgi:hypothetical protein